MTLFACLFGRVSVWLFCVFACVCPFGGCCGCLIGCLCVLSVWRCVCFCLFVVACLRVWLFWLCVCLSVGWFGLLGVCVFVCVCLVVCLSACLAVGLLCVFLSVWLSVGLGVCVFVGLFVGLCVCVLAWFWGVCLCGSAFVQVSLVD